MTDLAIRDEGHYLATVHEVRALAERIESVEDAKDLADRAATLRTWAERARLGQEQVNLATIAKLWAERRAGELLRDVPRERGFAHSPQREANATPYQETLATADLPKSTAERYQALAAIPADDFQAAIDEAAAEGPVSTAKVTKLAERGFEKRVHKEFFAAPTPAFDAFMKAGKMLIDKARPESAAGENWDADTRRLVREWAPIYMERISAFAAVADEPLVLRAVEGGGGTHGHQ